ncbi:conjugal transfer nickase/helicase domain-containing protein [Pseudomonas aeruginosa]|uniref:conjugal transfer nickase/helicase domain-containing protein n=1 Tax=Pseudomonas aeruginosa TaxID=287 RepID=UPI003D1575A0
MAWLKQGIASRRLIINGRESARAYRGAAPPTWSAPAYSSAMRRSIRKSARLAKQESQQDWQWIQKRFERLQLHRKQPNGLNIWTCEVTGP